MFSRILSAVGDTRRIEYLWTIPLSDEIGMSPEKREEQRVIRVDAEGENEVIFGIEISDGPKTYRLLITHPIAKEGLIEEIPRDSIESIATAKPGPRRQQPEIVDEE